MSEAETQYTDRALSIQLVAAYSELQRGILQREEEARELSESLGIKYYEASDQKKALKEAMADVQKETGPLDLRGADLSGLNLRGLDLAGANLEGANLEGAEIGYTHLEEANLKNANLQNIEGRDANLSGANLEGADLRSANLHGMEFEGANLRNTDLREASLEATNLREGADLRGADLRGAYISGAWMKKDYTCAGWVEGAELGDNIFDERTLNGSKIQTNAVILVTSNLTFAMQNEEIREYAQRELGINMDAIEELINAPAQAVDPREAAGEVPKQGKSRG